MKTCYVVTGAAGHLGGEICRQLLGNGETVRALALPGEDASGIEAMGARVLRGDVRDAEALDALFDGLDGNAVVLHTAGIVSITSDVPKTLFDVNVNGTVSVIEACRRHSARRLVYVSSVHAIPEPDEPRAISEIDRFDDRRVLGGYAKTKALATQKVLDAAAEGLEACVVQPSGILGPEDHGRNHVMEMIRSFLSGRLPACVAGGYDFVDVRDVADGCIRAARFGERGECYILSNQRYEVRELIEMLKRITGIRRVCAALPIRLAMLATPAAELLAKLRKKPPLFTRYSLRVLMSGGRFSHEKATERLGYRPRELFDTMKDTVAWLKRKPTRADSRN